MRRGGGPCAATALGRQLSRRRRRRNTHATAAAGAALEQQVQRCGLLSPLAFFRRVLTRAAFCAGSGLGVGALHRRAAGHRPAQASPLRTGQDAGVQRDAAIPGAEQHLGAGRRHAAQLGERCLLQSQKRRVAPPASARAALGGTLARGHRARPRAAKRKPRGAAGTRAERAGAASCSRASHRQLGCARWRRRGECGRQ